MSFTKKTDGYYAPDKDPNSVLDYSLDWSLWLGADTISVSSWTVPAGITKASDSQTTTATTIWLSGGTVGQTYTITNRITTVAGRIQDQSFKVTIKEN